MIYQYNGVLKHLLTPNIMFEVLKLGKNKTGCYWKVRSASA
jgi:hypothetical protein